MNTQEYRKVYVDVYAVMLRDGTVKPRRFLWEDGATYMIDRILHITPAASTKVGGRGIRYTVMIEGQEKISSVKTISGLWKHSSLNKMSKEKKGISL